MSTIKPTSGKTDTGRPGSAGQEKTLAALNELGQASAAAISTHTGLAYSTTTAKLRAIQAAGLACRQRHPDGTTTWAPAGTPPAGSPTAGKPPKLRRSRPPAAAEGKPATGRREPTATGRADSGGSNGSGTGQPDPGPGTPPAAGSPPGAGSPRARRAKGALRAQVLAVLQDHPDATFKVSQVCKQLPGASAGAIANALDKLVADGTARQVADKPFTYQAE